MFDDIEEATVKRVRQPMRLDLVRHTTAEMKGLGVGQINGPPAGLTGT